MSLSLDQAARRNQHDPNVPLTGEWERSCAFLALQARCQNIRWQGKIDLSALVQQTLFEAFQAASQLDGRTEAEKAAWVCARLAHNLNDEIRKLCTAKRDVRRELPLQVRLEESLSRLEQLLPATFTTPSQHVAREEKLVRLANALARLPENQRQAIELHHLRGQTLVEVAEFLGTTKPAVAGLLHRGLKRLRELLAEDAGDS